MEDDCEIIHANDDVRLQKPLKCFEGRHPHHWIYISDDEYSSSASCMPPANVPDLLGYLVFEHMDFKCLEVSPRDITDNHVLLALVLHEETGALAAPCRLDHVSFNEFDGGDGECVRYHKCEYCDKVFHSASSSSWRY